MRAPSTRIDEWPSPRARLHNFFGPPAGQLAARPVASGMKLRPAPPHCNQSAFALALSTALRRDRSAALALSTALRRDRSAAPALSAALRRDRCAFAPALSAALRRDRSAPAPRTLRGVSAIAAAIAT